ncbi:macrolide ABC transporter ATP-binding protein [Candidatus Magnetoovum chiemensis]|nr:macrolide ABC transporter ATP-binding protein [Candidatus Magnetoovum chiemensis]
MIIILKSLKKSYNLSGQYLEVLRSVDFDVNAGDFVAIMGRSGSGKSTLLNILGCLDKPSEGVYLLDGIDIMSKSKKELSIIRNRKIGFVFQNFNLLPRLLAWKNVELPLVYMAISAKDRKERAFDMLEQVGLSHRKTHRPTELSGGEQQRVAIARALINNPSIILADEPTGNLDSSSGADIINLFKKLHSEGKTIVMVTHDDAVAKHAQRVVHIIDGRSYVK